VNTPPNPTPIAPPRSTVSRVPKAECAATRTCRGTILAVASATSLSGRQQLYTVRDGHVVAPGPASRHATDAARITPYSPRPVPVTRRGVCAALGPPVAATTGCAGGRAAVTGSGTPSVPAGGPQSEPPSSPPSPSSRGRRRPWSRYARGGRVGSGEPSGTCSPATPFVGRRRPSRAPIWEELLFASLTRNI